jgi:hypothetical protein
MATKARIEINQVRKNNPYYTSTRELGYLANFLTKYLKGYALDFVQDAKGVLTIRAVYHAVSCSENEYATFVLEDYDVENVIAVIKSSEYPLDLIYKKFTIKFAK